MKDTLIIYQNKETGKRYIVTEKTLKDYITEKNAIKVITEANKLQMDTKTIKLRKYGKIEIYIK